MSLHVINAAPILNTPDFANVFGGADKKTLGVDKKGHLRQLEFIALPGMIFPIIKQISSHIFQINCSFYNSNLLFIDDRFTQHLPQKLEKNVPPYKNKKQILAKLRKLEGLPYCWGGNWSCGIPKILEFYPPAETLNNTLLQKWTLKGGDCSGILFEVTNAYTPRNTSELLSFGEGLAIEGKNITFILALVKPLDLIVFRGHVIIVIDNQQSIESREGYGVIIRPLTQTLEELLSEKSPVTTCSVKENIPWFVIRRPLHIA